ncbi:hypothetical protein [Paractinoplanes rishiriensis]|uniref:Uncharacterized protein n=1 Tax=Paractinoplanes rishiriensis TaxID=1050105 RepID=A0A919JTP2_9ACTN|nr:hypothetical protein [Actinoplanes rishiriensis]GIE93314.1 hypothetical protein Ari01nite_07790 [Actinoplanes rishiriensis]
MRVIHYVDPAPHERYPAVYDEQQIRMQQQRNHELYLRWKARQAEIEERDRKFRRFWTGFGAVIAVVLLTALFIGGWMLWQALAAIGLGALAVPLILGAGFVAVIGGRRCVTIIQHMH